MIDHVVGVGLYVNVFSGRNRAVDGDRSAHLGAALPLFGHPGLVDEIVGGVAGFG